jgi:hypothetical protein
MWRCSSISCSSPPPALPATPVLLLASCSGQLPGALRDLKPLLLLALAALLLAIAAMLSGIQALLWKPGAATRSLLRWAASQPYSGSAWRLLMTAARPRISAWPPVSTDTSTGTGSWLTSTAGGSSTSCQMQHSLPAAPADSPMPALLPLTATLLDSLASGLLRLPSASTSGPVAEAAHAASCAAGAAGCGVNLMHCLPRGLGDAVGSYQNPAAATALLLLLLPLLSGSRAATSRALHQPYAHGSPAGRMHRLGVAAPRTCTSSVHPTSQLPIRC